MTKKWIAINLMLLIGTVLLGRQLYVTASRFKLQNNPANIAKVPPAKKSAAEAVMPQPQPVAKVNEAEFAIIPGANLFTEARKPEEKEQAPAPEPVRRLDSPPVLVGIMGDGARRVAMIVDPAAGNAPGARRTQSIRIGDNYRGFVVTNITDNGMILEAGSSREVIPLFATGKTPQQGKTPTMAVRIVNFGPGQAGSATTAVASAAASPGRTTPVQSPTPVPGTRGSQPAGSAAQRGAAATQTQAPQQMIQQPSQALPNVFTDSQGRQVIQTPFGILPTQPTTPVKK